VPGMQVRKADAVGGDGVVQQTHTLVRSRLGCVMSDVGSNNPVRLSAYSHGAG
jgi:hypothetical protein